MRSKYYTKPQYNNLPVHIAQQLAALPALPILRGRGRERREPVVSFFLKKYYQAITDYFLGSS